VFVVIQSRAIHMEKCGEMAVFFAGIEGDVQQIIDSRHAALSTGVSPRVVATLCSTLIFMETFMMSAGSSGNLSYSLAMFQAAVEYIKTYKQGSTKPRTRIKTNSSRLRRSSISTTIEDRFAVKEDPSRRDAVRHNCYVWGITGALSSSAAGGSLPEMMQSLAIVSMISCGSKHCLAIDRQGCCFTWGWGGDGQLGHGSCDDIAVPTRVALIQDAVVQVAGGSGHSVALTSSGTVFTWGMHFNGQLGRDIGNDGEAALVPGLVSDLGCICDICAGGDSTFAYSEQSGLYAWGCNREGQLGINRKDIASASVPQQVTTLANVHLLGISVAASHALFIDLQSRVWGCGSNSNGQLGYGSDCQSLLCPTLLPSLRGIDVLSVACGFSCSLFLTAAGQVMPNLSSECFFSSFAFRYFKLVRYL
jgi:alpha-tubulin suppressor-like RCC1 family protein